MNDSTNKCPICNEGVLTEHVGKNHVEYKGHESEIDYVYSVCDSCGSEQTDAVQMRSNKSGMMRYRKEIDGLLVGSELRALRKRLRLTQAEAATVFGGGPVAFSKYERDEVAQSEAMDKLLRLADELPFVLRILLANGGSYEKKDTIAWEDARELLAGQQVRSKARKTHSFSVSISGERSGSWKRIAA